MLRKRLWLLTPLLLTLPILVWGTQTPKHTMVVFVHGTLAGIPTGKAIKTLNKKGSLTLTNALNGKLCEEYLNATRDQGIHVQPIGKLGLERITPSLLFTTAPASKSVEELDDAASVMASCFKQSHRLIHQDANQTFSFYTYGWSGSLNSKARVKDAEQMYHCLFREKEALTQAYGNVELVILTHSHGGNTALNLAQIHEKENKTFAVDCLAMFGVPIQSETEKYVTSPLFKTIYSVYSKQDVIQVLDVVSTKDFFSRRCFKKKYAPYVHQIQIKLDKTAPGHCELWINGYFFALYRKSLSIYPLPVSAFTPLLLHATHQFEKPSKHIKIHLARQKDAYLITATNKATQKKWSTTHIYPSSWYTSIAQYSGHLKKHFKNLYKNYFSRS